MSLAARSVRRHPLWLIPLIAALAVGAFLILPTSHSQAAPPANDTCGVDGAGAQPLQIGESLEGDTSEAVNDYDAVVTPTQDPSVSAVPADGPDVVYKLSLTDTQIVQVTIKAPFQASVYAFPAIDGNDTFTTADCGKALSLAPGATFANDGGFLVLFSLASDEFTHWYIVVDSWTADEKGPFEIGVSYTSIFNSVFGGQDTQAIIGSLLKAIRQGNNIVTATINSLADSLADDFTQWDFAEGSTRDDFEVFITLLSDVTQEVTVFYFADPATLPAGSPNPIVATVSLTAGERKTLRGTNPAEFGPGAGIDFATRVVGVAPFQASAIMYSNRDVGLGVPTNGVQNIQGEHN